MSFMFSLFAALRCTIRAFASIASYKDDSFLIAITCELVVEVDDAEKFLQNNIKCGIEKGYPGSGDDYQYSDGKRIYIRIEPYDGKYRVHLKHME
ncbi:hypothetical protein [Ruminococcus albus]|uniref:hypothetical protein n=1 Tax=Ruminococcus albus TaxID=1264 RepID=UPI000465234B|nr:hypothetical protein [Ruminococcus albus]